MGRWAEALEVADEHSAIQIKAVHHVAAAHAEALGDAATAAHRYESAGTAATQVPRMLLLSGAQAELEGYAAERHRGDPELARWWGGFLASQGAVEDAAAVYEAADDTLSQVLAPQSGVPTYGVCTNSDQGSAIVACATQMECGCSAP